MSKKQIKSILKTAAFAAFAFMLIFYSDTVSGAVDNGINLCTSVLIPSLYPFMFLSSFMVKSGCSEDFGRLFGKGFKKVTGLPGCAASVVIISLLGGYPAGAQTVSSLYSSGELSKKDSEKLLCFCVCAGPVFLCQTLGRVCFNSFKAGLVLVAAQVISTLFLGFFVCFSKKDKKNLPPKNPVSSFKNISLSTAFVNSVGESAVIMLKVCAYVIIFTALIGIADVTGFSLLFKNVVYLFSKNEPLSESLLYALSETSAGCMSAASAGIPFTAFAALFGGFCVHFQIFSITENIGINKPKFILFRFIHGISAAVISAFLLLFVKTDIACSATVGKLQIASPSIPGAASLFILCLASIIFIPRANIMQKDEC